MLGPALSSLELVHRVASSSLSSFILVSLPSTGIESLLFSLSKIRPIRHNAVQGTCCRGFGANRAVTRRP